MAGRRRTVALTGCAALIAVLAACGPGRPGPASPSAGSSPSAGGSPSAEAQPTDRSPHGVMLSAVQAMDTARRARISYRIAGTGGGQGDSADGILYWAPKTIMQLKWSTPGATNQLIVLDTACYQGGDAATAERLGGPHWEKCGAGAGPDGHPQPPYSALADRLNPLAAVAAAADTASVQLLGEEKLADTAVEHYRATVSVADYAAAHNQLTDARRRQLVATLSPGGVGTLTLDLWLNDKDQLVQLHRTGQGGTGELDDTVQYRDFGGAFSVQAPPESDVRDAATP